MLRQTQWLIPAVMLMMLSACASAPQEEARVVEPDIEEQLGVKILTIRSVAKGFMLDLRYRVLDKDKAVPVLDRSTKPYLILEKDNSKLHVPVAFKLGSLRQTTKHVQENRNYFMLFANPGRYVKSGDVVRVVIGDFQTGRLVVN